MFGGNENKPSNKDQKYAGLEVGKHAVTLDDVVSGVSDKTGKQYWICKLSTQAGIQFDHFINCEANEYKTEEKIAASIARQMESLLIYDAIGAHDKLESFVTKAIDLTYQLKGKTIEFTIQRWDMNGKSGVWGEITGFLDTPNEAIQTVAETSTASASTVDVNEEIGF